MLEGGFIVLKSVLEAVKLGFWDFEPPTVDSDEFDAIDAMPGTKDKLDAMARRVQSGLPLWNNQDRNDMDDPPPKHPR